MIKWIQCCHPFPWNYKSGNLEMVLQRAPLNDGSAHVGTQERAIQIERHLCDICCGICYTCCRRSIFICAMQPWSRYISHVLKATKEVQLNCSPLFALSVPIYRMRPASVIWASQSVWYLSFHHPAPLFAYTCIIGFVPSRRKWNFRSFFFFFRGVFCFIFGFLSYFCLQRFLKKTK